MPSIPYWCDDCRRETLVLTRITDTPSSHAPCEKCHRLVSRRFTPCLFTVSCGHIYGKYGRYDVKTYDYYAHEAWPAEDAHAGRES